jgi:hypothetical protein
LGHVPATNLAQPRGAILKLRPPDDARTDYRSGRAV